MSRLRRLIVPAIAAALSCAAGFAHAAAPPAIPPIADANRVDTWSLNSVTDSVQVSYPIFGDCTDLVVTLNGTVLVLNTDFTCASAGNPDVNVDLLPLPITDMVITFSSTPTTNLPDGPPSSGTLVVTGAWHPRRTSQPTAPGINRREFNDTISTIVAAQREFYYFENTYIPSQNPITIGTTPIGGTGACNDCLVFDNSGVAGMLALGTGLAISGGDINLQPPGLSTLGGVDAIASLAHNWISYIDTNGQPHQAQPSVADLSNLGSNVLNGLEANLGAPNGLLGANLASGTINVGNGSGIAAAVTPAGDWSIDNAGGSHTTGENGHSFPTSATAGDFASIGANGMYGDSHVSASQAASKIADYISMADYGLSTGASDNTTAVSSSLAALGAGGGTVCAPAGDFKFASQLTYNFSSGVVRIRECGDGSGATVFEWTASVGAGQLFNYNNVENSVRIDGITFETDVAGGGAAVELQDTNSIPTYNTALPNVFRDVVFTGAAQATEYWTFGVKIVSVNNVNFNDVYQYGETTDGLDGGGYYLGGFHETTTGCTASSGSTALTCSSLPSGTVTKMFVYDNTTKTALNGTQQISSISGNNVTLSANTGAAVGSGDSLTFTNAAIVYNFENCASYLIGTHFLLDTGVQGIQIANYNATGGNYAFNENSTNEVGLVQIAVLNSQFNVLRNVFGTGSATFPLADVKFENDLIFANDSTGSYPAFNLQNATRTTFVGNTFFQQGSKGSSVALDIQGNSAVGNITGNIISGFSAGVELASGTSGFTLNSNTYNGNTTNEANGGGTACPASSSGNCIGTATP